MTVQPTLQTQLVAPRAGALAGRAAAVVLAVALRAEAVPWAASPEWPVAQGQQRAAETQALVAEARALAVA